MKSILMSIQSKWLAKILNGEKTIEISKSMPKCELPIDVYLYCTKDKKHKLEYCDYNGGCWSANDGGEYFNGKVVAKFTLNKVEEIELNRNHFVNEEYSTDELCEKELLEQSCLTYKDLDDYLKCEIGYAWHISKLEIFDKPKELGEFSVERYAEMPNGVFLCNEPLTKAPQSWQYIYVEEEK